MGNNRIPLNTVYHIDSSPYYPDNYPVKDNYYHRVIKSGDKIRATLTCGGSLIKALATNFVEGQVEEKDGILWVHILRHYKSDTGYEEMKNQASYKLINNFINRGYAVAIIDADNEKKLTPVKKQGGLIYET